MQLRPTLFSGLLILLPVQVLSSSLSNNLIHAVHGLHHRVVNTDDVMRNQVDSIMSSFHVRDDSLAPGSITQSNLSSWNTQTRQACDSAMSSMMMATINPSGMAVCYNVAFLDNATGVFEADVRMYNISAPFDPWTGVTAKDISMTLSFADATVQEVNSTTAQVKRAQDGGDGMLSWPPIKEREVKTEDDPAVLLRRATGPQQIKALMYVGQINMDKLDDPISNAQLQSIVTPRLSLAARSPLTNNALNTTLSSKSSTASFVNGVFSQKSTTNQNTTTSNNVELISFVIPGYRLAPLQVPGLTIPTSLIFPTGMIITLIWTVLFIVTVGYGTYGRIKFREQYRRRVKMQEAIGWNTI